MSKIVYMGVDVGKKGFITAFYEGSYFFYPMPTKREPTGKKLKSGKESTKEVFCEFGFADLLDTLKNDFKDCEFIVGIEKVNGRTGWSAQNTFSFGYVAGMTKAIFIILGAEIFMIEPKKWQALIRKGHDLVKIKKGSRFVTDNKATAEAIVRKDYPEIDFRKNARCRGFDDNKVDSFLICKYIMLTYGK